MKNPFRLLLFAPVPWVFVIGYLLGVAVERARPSNVLINRESPLVGWALFLIGAFAAGWGLLSFRRARTTTVPGASSAQLVTWGPYRYTRNPMYVGLTLAYIGEAFILEQAWPLVFLPLVIAYVNWIVIPLEERKLGESFGAKYDDYRSRVGRWL